jgi:hypothetical protein
MPDPGAAEAIQQEARKKIAEEKAAFGKEPTAPRTGWDFASQTLPRIPFPWEGLPSKVADSLQQLARACATSPSALPGSAFCLMSSIIGRALTVSPKDGWDSPMNIWHMDIRESGEGKTPAIYLMAEPIFDAQMKEEIRYREEMADYKKLTRQEQAQEPPPKPARGYFVSDLTLEGLRDDLINSPHGGIVGIHDEISTFLTGQNQYKAKGTDREAWLKLFDGKPARIVRAGKAMYLNGARISIFGGVQPKVFKTFFAGEDGLYLEDGTFYRFLAIYEPPTYYDLTAESWGNQDREKWEQVLRRAMDWADEKIYTCGGQIEKPTRMVLDSEAQEKFLEWRNQLYSCKDRLPAQLRGFLPKAVEYALRLTGVIHCIQMFSMGKTPQTVLSLRDLDRGIKAVSFYLGQIQGALRLITENDYSPPEISERSILLAQTLNQLKSHIENGRLAVGFIHKHHSLMAPPTQRIGKPRGMGAALRAAKLTMAPGKHDANGHRGVSCLQWDNKTETFIEQCLECLQHQRSQEWEVFEDADDEEPMSTSSANAADADKDFADVNEGVSGAEIFNSREIQDIADVAEVN